ncbi:recombinase family protein [Azospirillum lipoferum]|uniref:Recombinase n=1 Tax=Azospirillum lipoferum (strain 4B) TaxID=862719 RepID=G7Z8K9_AZOL4|nr:recombinase family protein [Azospirillum lipoferum]CBS87309.1 Putative recombinase [Azospirillum lipoferum 4B]
MKAAIYARYSSDNQHERSIEDQVRICRQHAERHGGTIVDVYPDYAISGSHLKTRPQAQKLLEDAKAGLFDTVITEGLDRLSRDQEDIAAIFKRLKHHGIVIDTVQEGVISELHIGVKGTMNALFLRDLATKVRRGQEGRAKAGSVPAGLSYGYDVVREFDEKGEPVRGKRRVNEQQAAVIREIFDKVALGFSPRAIAKDLNSRGIPSPEGKTWNASTINGNAARRNGILYNEAYIGFLIYNRLRMDKDPDTGKHVPRLNKPESWTITEVPGLRIVTDEQWDRVQAVKAGFANRRGAEHARRPKHLLSGLVRCGCCGGSYTVKSKDQLACSTYRESGTCTNNRTIRVGDLQERVIVGIKSRLLSSASVALFVKVYGEERRRLEKEGQRGREDIAARLGKLTRQIDNIVNAIADGVASATMRQKLASLEEEKGAAEAELATIVRMEAKAGGVVEFPTATIDSYRQQVESLGEDAFVNDDARQEAMNAVRALIARIDVHPGERRGQTQVKAFGLIEKLISPAQDYLGGASSAVGRTATMVAAEGFEPPTKGL